MGYFSFQLQAPYPHSIYYFVGNHDSLSHLAVPLTVSIGISIMSSVYIKGFCLSI